MSLGSSTARCHLPQLHPERKTLPNTQPWEQVWSQSLWQPQLPGKAGMEQGQRLRGCPAGSGPGTAGAPPPLRIQPATTPGPGPAGKGPNKAGRNIPEQCKGDERRRVCCCLRWLRSYRDSRRWPRSTRLRSGEARERLPLPGSLDPARRDETPLLGKPEQLPEQLL